MPILMPDGVSEKCSIYPIGPAYDECVKESYRAAMAAGEAMREQREFEQMVLYISLGAVAVAIVLAFIFRKQIRSALENLFIGAAAKTISSKRDFKAYREDIAKRVREKSEQ